ncbi:MAG: glucuronate isomerase [Clostridiales bacterium]|nr:glucuronate isomerase [Clostridiales bacterium]MDY3745664.1 glucuronate isomerase [Lachnospiraceae bacterium]
MKKFIDEDFMLESVTAKVLYEKYAAGLPIIDYHCHINPKEIYEDLKYENITQVWLYGDHYKWRVMRASGIEERYITGDADDYEKFCKYAETLECCIGNPLYHWSHMELKKYFGYDGILSSETADKVWHLCNKVLREQPLSVRRIIEESNVEVICTTDDPTDSLIWHQKLKEDNYSVKVLPAWRPDQLVNIEKTAFAEYIKKLGEASGVNITDWYSLKDAIRKRIDYFDEKGCCVSDHGVAYIPYRRCSESELDRTLRNALEGQKISACEIESYKTEVLMFMASEYKKRDWVMQFHYGCDRNNNSRQFKILGPDTGYDCISNYAPSGKIVRFLDDVNLESGLPKTILYSLNPSDNAVIDSIIGSFQNSDAAGKIQHGSAWWFNDNKAGMEQQLISLASMGVLGKFVGMLTDSRSFLSYTRHDYFRRILCSLIGRWVDQGEYPKDDQMFEKIIRGICHDNAETYFGF